VLAWGEGGVIVDGGAPALLSVPMPVVSDDGSATADDRPRP
jgi:hypothetical protein